MQFVDNLSDSARTRAAGDALYAETLYIMLAVPGALIALGLAYLAALGTVERDRRDLALLRARGATRRELLALAAAGERADRRDQRPARRRPRDCVGAAADRNGRADAAAIAVTVAACVALAIAGALAARIAAAAGC